jgi:amidase
VKNDSAPGGGQTDFDRRSVLKIAGVAAGAALAASPRVAEAAPRISEIVLMDAAALRAAILARQVSCVEVMQAFLNHVEQTNPKVNAIVALQDGADLLAQARERDRQIARGQIMGPLHGFPHAVKDLFWVKGVRSTAGSPILKDFIPTEDSLPVARLRAAGAIFIGKTNAPEFGLGSHTFNPVYGATGNAYNQTRSAGGSSGGAAVSLALRMTPLADGSDYGGSLRNPAGWNNVFGFRTGYGVVASGGHEVWLPSMGVTGPMARTVADLALLLSVQAGYDPRAPLSVPGDGRRFAAPLGGDIRGKKIGWIGEAFGPYEPGVLDLCQSALKTFEALGCAVEEAAPDQPPEPAWQAFIRLRWWQEGGGLAAFYDDPARRALMKPEAIWEVEGGRGLSAFDITHASVTRTAWFNAFRRLFERYDYLIAPTAQVFPFAIAERWPRQIAGQAMRTYHEWMRGVCLVSLSGCPSLAVPAGFGVEGLPMGLQIIAPIGHERDCLELAHAYEQATPWTSKRLPPLLT